VHRFDLLWLIVIGCLLKVFVQVEFGRYALEHRKTTLEAMNEVPAQCRTKIARWGTAGRP
jgi:hypothetical protein